MIKKILKNKAIIVILICLVLFFVVSGIFYQVDYRRVVTGQEPILAIHTVRYDDGGTTCYYGLGYQIIKWKRLSSEYGRYLTGVERHYLFGMAIPPDSPQVELELTDG